MRISYEWLGDFVDLDGVTPKDAADVLTRLGVEVESLTLVDLSQIVIGKVLEQVKHPTSRNDLWVHQVDIGGKTLQIIAGAPNAVPGSLVPVALPGTTWSRPGEGGDRRSRPLPPLHRRRDQGRQGGAKSRLVAAEAARMRRAPHQQHRRHHQLRAAGICAAAARIRPGEADRA